MIVLHKSWLHLAGRGAHRPRWWSPRWSTRKKMRTTRRRRTSFCSLRRLHLTEDKVRFEWSFSQILLALKLIFMFHTRTFLNFHHALKCLAHESESLNLIMNGAPQSPIQDLYQINNWTQQCTLFFRYLKLTAKVPISILWKSISLLQWVMQPLMGNNGMMRGRFAGFLCSNTVLQIEYRGVFGIA